MNTPISALFIFLFSVLLFSQGCKKGSEDTPKEQRVLVSKYLTDHVAPMISIDGDIVFRFRQEWEPNRSIKEPISIRPSIKGETVWLDDRTIAFQPMDRLPYEQSYRATLNTKDLFDAEDNISINFKTKPLHLTLSDIQQKVQLTNGLPMAHLSGWISTNQYLDSEAVEGMIKKSGSDQPITWVHSADGKSHQFIIENIPQTDKVQKVSFTWAGGRLQPLFGGERDVMIDAKGVFEVKDIYVVQQPDRLVRVTFTQPLLKNQNFSGLISIDKKNDLKQIVAEGNILDIYLPMTVSQKFDLHISDAIRSYDNSNLESSIDRSLTVQMIKPALKLVETGVIVPDMGPMTFPFQAVNLDTVDVEIFKIYDQNVLQFLQSNNLSGSYELNQVGKMIHREKVAIQTSRPNQWSNISLDLRTMLQADIDAIYQVRLGFRPSYVDYDCDTDVEGYRPPKENESIMDGRWYGWEDRENPCALAYYHADRFASRNVLMSNVAPIVKRAGGLSYSLTATDLRDATILRDVQFQFYNFQQILIGEASTGASGINKVTLGEKPAFAIARHSKGVMYVDLRNANANSVTDFNTGGKKSKGGVDAYMYSERGVYRPGDTIFMYAILQDKDVLPSDHPVTLTVKDPQGQVQYKSTTVDHLDKIYSFDVLTDQSDVTGQWMATLTVGAHKFNKNIRVETIKPNRLRIKLEHDELITYTDRESRNVKVASSWLHGAPASGLTVQIDGQWKNDRPQFKEYKSYAFSDPARKIDGAQRTLFKGKLNEQGETNFPIQLDKDGKYPFMLRANVTNRVWEKGGDFSETYGSLKVSPYESYVGVKMPKSRWGSHYVKIGESAIAKAVSVDVEGRPVGNRRLTIGIYDIKWRWWYYRNSNSNIYQLNSDQHPQAVIKQSVVTGTDGEVEVLIDTDKLEYGRKLIRICDVESGHCTGQFFYASGWYSSISDEERESMSKLVFSANKPIYEAGDEVMLHIPSEKGAKILISIESDSEVISEEWIEAEGELTEYRWIAEAHMAPNVYAHVSLVQPYEGMNNDLPIRMYGILPITIKNPESYLTPVIDGPTELKPKKPFTITVSEEDGLPMTYTISIVDEGLLDLTNYKTPDPHNAFYTKRSLGVKTWDVYDDVLYGLNGTADQIISIGGDGENAIEGGQKKAIRFKPVVFSSGPHQLSKNGKGTHTFTMPNYIGSVRAMVVARKAESYGDIEKTMPVKTPLMILPTVPRVLSQGDEIQIPVSVFAMKDDILDVSLNLKTSDLLTPLGASDNLNFSQQGEIVGLLSAKVGEEIGIARMDISANGGRYSASQQIEIDVRNPNPAETKVESTVLVSDQDWNPYITPFGVSGTNTAVLELSTFPNVNLEQRIGSLLRYPYGCLEQTTSSAFPQLYLADLSDVVSQDRIDKHIQYGIRRLKRMQSSSGGFKYWPGSYSGVHHWSTSYAGHFLIEAKKKGYYIDSNILEKWASFQKKQADNYKPQKQAEHYRYERYLLDQSYRLYTLALYGSPNLPAMNLHSEHKDLPPTAKFLLAAAYAKSGKPNVSLKLIEGASTEIDNYENDSKTFGSDVRDMALIAQALLDIGNKQQAMTVLRNMVERMNSKVWLSTQSLSFGLLTVGRCADELDGSGILAEIKTESGQQIAVDYSKPVYTVEVPVKNGTLEKWNVVNKGDQPIYASFQLTGQPSIQAAMTTPSKNDNISLDVKYKDLSGNIIDVTELRQGTDFIAEVTITNKNTMGTTLDEMALSHMMPSGWEIRSGRLSDINQEEDAYEYRDVRDDRVDTFFDLKNRKKYAILLNATYAGDYYLPPIIVEAMYNKAISARTKAQRIKVLPAQ